MTEGLQMSSELEGKEWGEAGGGTADGTGWEFVPRHLFIFPWYCSSTGIELQTTFLLRSLIPHSNRGCNLTMLQLPCLKAVGEMFVCMYREKQKTNTPQIHDRFHHPWSLLGMREKGAAGAEGLSEDWLSVLLNDSRGLHQVKSVCALQTEAKQNGLKTVFHI